MRCELILAATLLTSAANAACPGSSGPLPSSFTYEVTDARHVATASVSLPMTVDRVAPHAAAVQAEPTWTNLQAKGSIAPPMKLKPLVQNDKLRDTELKIEAEADPQCPGSTMVRARFGWSFSTLARLMGGDAKDIPALFALAARDEVIARALTSPGMARAVAGPARVDGVELVRIAPFGLDVPDDAMAKLRPRLEAIQSPKKATMGEVLGVFYDVHRNATSIAGLGVLTRMGATPTLVRPACDACDIAYDITAAQAPDGKGGALSFGLHGYAK